MRSHLTRNVYRRLLAHHGSSAPAASSPSYFFRRHQLTAPLVRPPARRTFFGIFKKPPRQFKDTPAEPGYVTILEFRSREVDNLRPQPREELLRGFRNFFQHKTKEHKSVNSTQAFCASRLLHHLLNTNGESVSDSLSIADLRTARDALLVEPERETTEWHCMFSKELYEEINKRLLASSDDGQIAGEASEFQPIGGVASLSDFKLYLQALCQYGAALEAQSLLNKFWQEPNQLNETLEAAKLMCIAVLRGLAKEGKTEELVQQADLAEKAGTDYRPPFHEIMTTFFAKRDNVAQTKRWFEKPVYQGWPATAVTYSEIIKFSVRNNEQEWTKKVFQQLCDSNPSKELWDVIFQWAVALEGKGVDDIRGMFDIVVRHNQDDPSCRPDMDTLNLLIQAAIERKDAYMAERFLSLARDLDLAPNAATYMLQMNYRIEAADLSGAHMAYENLMGCEVHQDEDLPMLNKYIRALASSSKPYHDRIIRVLEESVEYRHAFIEPETVVALCRYFLKIDQQYDVIDIFAVHTTHYSIHERRTVRRALVEYCEDKKNSTARVWDAYSLLRQFFPETELEDRVALMDVFFARKRADMACYVFGHMRQHDNADIRPTAAVYVRCLEGIGRSPDLESLKMVHNMLKMDATIQMSTKLYNGLMIAYAACEEEHKALDFWKDITASVEGPTYHSLNIVFRVCQTLPYGYESAREIWAKMQKMDIDVPAYVYNSYVACMAGQGHLQEVIKITEAMEKAIGQKPSVHTLGMAYQAFRRQEWQQEFEEWAKGSHPGIWSDLQQKRMRRPLANSNKFLVGGTLKA